MEQEEYSKLITQMAEINGNLAAIHGALTDLQKCLLVDEVRHIPRRYKYSFLDKERRNLLEEPF